MTTGGMNSTMYERVLCSGNEFSIDVLSRQYLAIPTDNSAKIPKFNEYIGNELHTTYDDITLLTLSADTDDGLYWMSRPYFMILDPTLKYIYIYHFTDRPKSIEIDAEGGAIVKIIVHTSNGICWRHRLPHVAPTRDSNSDGCPDVLDKTRAYSPAWVFRAAAFNYVLQVEDIHFLTSDGDHFKTSDGKQFLVMEL